MQNLGVGGGGANRVHYGKCGSGEKSVFTHVTSRQMFGTKESVGIRKEFNSHRTGLGHQHGRHFIVLGD